MTGDLTVRRYGAGGPEVVVLHGGPAARGNAAPIAEGLADRFRVLEPLQRGSGGQPLTVRRHIRDLYEVVTSCTGGRPALVGESWGAMLALAYAAEHPGNAGPVVLVGCGTFDTASRRELKRRLDRRVDAKTRAELERLEAAELTPGERLRRQYRLLLPLYSCDPVPGAEAAGPGPGFDMQAHRETWSDMERLQKQGVYPAAFAAIRSPVLMIHGDCDPHPGRQTFETLRRTLPHLEYCELHHCGHSPWTERRAREPFFEQLRSWLVRACR